MAAGEHSLETETFVRRRLSEVFAFFADAENLEELTPPELRFEISTPVPIAMGAGTIIEYRLRLFGLPLYWQTLISHWEPGVRFVDEQVKGPYAIWVHTHTFEEADGGTVVRDHVRYKLPFFPFGEIAYPVVRLQLARIFGYRKQRLKELFGD